MQIPPVTLLLIAGLAATALTGCHSLRKPGFPRQSYSQDQQIKDMEAVFDLSRMVAEYYDLQKAGATEEELRSSRDRFIDGRMALIDLNYNRFVTEFCFNKQAIDTGAEMTQLGLNLATTAVGGAGTKTILAAIASGVSGAKLAIDKNFFYERTIPVLVTSMNAQRKEALIPILQGRRQTTQDYPLTQALSDLDFYYFAGTFLGALQSIQADAGAKEQQMNQVLNRIRNTRFLEDDAGTLLQQFWMPGAPHDFHVNMEHQDKIIGWLKANGLEAIPIQSFVTGEEFAEQRKRAVRDLRLTSNP
jgi:hypothetical protein